MPKRIESDLLGEMEIPKKAYYGVQTQRALDNFDISWARLDAHPRFIKALAAVKIAAAKANNQLGVLEDKLCDAIIQASEEVMTGKFDKEFPIDMIQGGAGTSTNMNINEVVANRANEILGGKKGEYEFVTPNDHVNLSQSTNDAYPTAIKIALMDMNEDMILHINDLVQSFRTKGKEFAHVLKMGRTQLQDAVPMTLGQEFEAYAATLEEEVKLLRRNADLFKEVNMGATAIGTGINSVPGYAEVCTRELGEVTNYKFILAANLVEATPDTGSYVIYSSAMKRLAVKLSKIANDLRLLSSGPRAGFGEINLPMMQPGSSIMPGKVNPVIPEVVNQVCFKVIGNDLTVTFAAEAGQLQLNVMEPVLVQSIMESIKLLEKAMDTFRTKCIDGITANEEVCMNMVKNSIGIVTALNPYIGYKASSKIAKEALETGRGVYDLVLEHKVLTKEKLDDILRPEKMIKPHKF
ncbi:MAG: aspartate ammonia-lyase [Flavobacteriales bacterium]|nr:aspartate ammonia-lyase [Flavobacteriales bacterium]